MEIKSTPFDGPQLIQLKMFKDERGFFVERYNPKIKEALGLKKIFRQDNHSRSLPQVLRGLHYQHTPAQGKLVGCLQGKILDVIVDLRWDSTTFGQNFSVELSSENGQMLWIPPGFAHGIYNLGDQPADLYYKVDEVYYPQGEGTLLWNDPDLKISWPTHKPLLSPKDSQGSLFSDYKKSTLFQKKWWSL